MIKKTHHPSQAITITRRVTSPFLQALPPNLEEFNAHMQIRLQTENKYEITIDPCILNWETMTITIIIPLDRNKELCNINDFNPIFFEAIEAAFLTLIYNCAS